MKPKPVVTARICSVCGLPWADHDEAADVFIDQHLAKRTRLLPATYEDGTKRHPLLNGFYAKQRPHVKHPMPPRAPRQEDQEAA